LAAEQRGYECHVDSVHHYVGLVIVLMAIVMSEACYLCHKFDVKNIAIGKHNALRRNVGLIYTRTFSDLNGITQAMDQQISRILAQGIGEGRGPMDIARELNERVDKIGISRARMLARTEIVSAHAEASINAYEEAGLEGVDVEAEILNGSDPCPECQDLAANGPYTISEARSLIPAHPNCVCSLNPKVVNGSGIDLI